MRTWSSQFAVIAGLALPLALVEPVEATKATEVTFRIPKDYNGFLFLAMDAPGGLIPDKEYDLGNHKSVWPQSFTLEFDAQGVARYGYESLPNDVEKVIVVERDSGRILPLVSRKQQLGDRMPARAVLRDGGRGVLRKGRRELIVEVFLVGDPAKFPDTLIGYNSEAIDQLLLKHFGLPLPEKAKPNSK